MQNLSWRLMLSFAVLMTAILFSGASAGLPQGTGAGPKIGSIRVRGQKRFSAEQVIAASGLRVGQMFQAKDLDAVAERLGKSGAFQEVTYSYVPQGGEMSVEFKVEESGKFRACHFDNFVWLTDDEIQARLKKELPLYTGMAPETGEMLEEIPHVLEKLSLEKGIAVRVSRRVQQATIEDTNWGHMFAAEGADEKVQSLRFTGKLSVNSEDLQKEAAGLVGREYSAFQSGLFATLKLLPYYQERGYLQAKVETQAPKILSHSEGSSDYAMEVVYAVTEGSIYHWAPAEWSGNQAITGEKLEALTSMKPNEMANRTKIDEGWDAVQKEYAKSGYIEARVSPEPVFSEQDRRVHYRVSVAEGPQYHMGNFMISGVPPKIAGRLKDRWRLKPGDVYDASYVSDFVKKEVFPAVQGAGGGRAKARVQTVPNRERYVMDVTVKVE